MTYYRLVTGLVVLYFVGMAYMAVDRLEKKAVWVDKCNAAGGYAATSSIIKDDKEIEFTCLHPSAVIKVD